jgi:hypothetical protein
MDLVALEQGNGSTKTRIYDQYRTRNIGCIETCLRYYIRTKMDIVICLVILSMDMPFVAHGYYGEISDIVLIVFKTKILGYAMFHYEYTTIYIYRGRFQICVYYGVENRA